MTMLCRNPYTTSDGKAYGCGQCTPCRVNRRRKWQARMVLEAMQHADNTFVTLTYADEHLPKTADGLATLHPWDLRNFLDKMRYHYGQAGRRGIRFYAVGEYGDVTFRPHYHLAMFNTPNCQYGMSRYSKLVRKCCPICDMVRGIWGKGYIFLGTLEKDSAGYVASYINKKMTKEDDPRLLGRHPEFVRMSRMPGIGANGLWELADILLRDEYRHLPDVPTSLRQDGKENAIPLDRYLRGRLRELIGRDKKAPEFVLDEVAAELSSLRERAYIVQSPSRKTFSKEIFKALILEDGDGEYAKFEARRKIFNQKRNAL